MTFGTTTISDASGAQIAPDRLIGEELLRVERRICELAESGESALREIATSLIEAGGKRVRPALALLVFRAAGGIDPSDTIEVSAALELIHSATLLHDDIIDSGLTRRGQPSPLARYGTALTLVTGDFLFSRAFGVAGRFDEKVVGWAASACESLCEGEVMQQRFWRNPAVTLDDYLEIARRKTASLFSQAARIGAHFAGASDVVVEAMRRMGLEIGIGFQMVDDLLDVIGPAELIGKPVGGDLREGTPALPIVLGLRELPVVKTTFIDRSPTPEGVATALAEIRDSSVLAEVRDLAARRIRAAQAELTVLAPSTYGQALSDLTDALIARTS